MFSLSYTGPCLPLRCTYALLSVLQLINAPSPTNSQISERAPGAVTMVNLGPEGKIYNLKELSSGTFSKTYEVVNGYRPDESGPPIPAIVKLLTTTKPEKDKAEVGNLKKVSNSFTAFICYGLLLNTLDWPPSMGRKCDNDCHERRSERLPFSRSFHKSVP